MERPNKKQKQLLKQCIWDLNLTPEEFWAIVTGQEKRKWPDRDLCVARLLESINWFDLKEMLPPEELVALWNENVKAMIRSEKLKEGMDYACRVLRENRVSSSG